uniref:C3H1-type domain-containing protein n=1 Tax=Angiostrongylus cantonensis TaxID=6313 RepID=A0A0K0CUU1_ANGCA
MSDRLPDAQTKLNENDEVGKTAAAFMKTCLDDYAVYEMNDKQNTTCPPDLLGFDVSLLRNLTAQDAYLREQLNSCVKSALASQDPCTLTDDEREELLRQKRKEDAYKTALCESYRRTQTCSYGKECRFAHGVDELRLPAQPRGRSHPKYKTVLCDKFSNTGYCKYGARCQFIHKITNPAILAQQMLARENALRTQTHRYIDHCSNFHNSFNSGSGRRLNDMNTSMPIEMINRRSDVDRALARAGLSLFMKKVYTELAIIKLESITA